MTAQEVIDYFKKEYPGKNILAIPKDNPMEIICEVDPSAIHLEFNRAIAAIKKSEPHYHLEAVETYEVLSGELKLMVDDEVITLKKGDSYVIKPRQVHWAEGNFTLVRVDSEPGWKIDDHYLVD